MKNMKRAVKTGTVKSLATLGFVGCAVMSSPFAAADDYSGWIGGLSIGQTSAKIDDSQISANLLGTGLTTNSISDDDSDLAYKLFGGYKFNKNFAVEAGYFKLGQFGFSAATTPPGTLSGNIRLKGLNLDAVGILPLQDKFSVFGRLGLNYAQAKDAFAGTGAVTVTNPSPSKSDLNIKIGLGAQYNFTESVGMRGEWERYRINDAVGSSGDIDLVSVGLVIMLDAKKSAPAQKEKACVVAAPPVLVIVPVKTKTQQYCSILDFEFEINKDAIEREEKEKLAVLGTFMNKYPDTTAIIEGHSDDVGSHELNLQLSKKRADSVVSYMVDDLHIAPSRLTSVGYGEAFPIADNSTEAGKQANRRINAVVACARDIVGLKVQPAKMTMALEMEFDPYKAEIAPQYKDGLSEVAKFMKANPTVSATVEGHAGRYIGKVRVTAEEAMQVSQQRASAVVNYLVDELGVPRARLSTSAFGLSRRVAYATTLEGQQENRRVNIIFNYGK